MSIKNRDDLIDSIADSMTEAVDMDTLIEFFYNAQYEWLEDLSDNELIEQAELYNVEVEEDNV